MKIKGMICGALLAALAWAAPAAARDQLGQRDPVTIDPNRAYIFFRSSHRGDVRFMREVDAAEQAAWQAERDEAFARARARWERRIAEWDRMTPGCRGNGRMTPQCQSRGERPAEVTEETFAFAPPEMDNFIMVDGGRQFTRDGQAGTYFMAVDPGSYVLYGPVTSAANGTSFGTCLCMGSIRFEARPGQVVDLGEIRFPRIEQRIPLNERRFGLNRVSVMALVPPSPSMVRPDKLAGHPVVPAQLRAADKVPNYFAVEIDRLPAIPGVLAYERDRVIDLGGASTSAE